MQFLLSYFYGFRLFTIFCFCFQLGDILAAETAAQLSPLTPVETTQRNTQGVSPLAPESDSNPVDSIIDVESGVSRGRSPWSLAWFNWASVNRQNYAHGEGRLETYNYLSFNYRFTRLSQISLRPEFYINGAGKDFTGKEASNSIEMGDVYLQYNQNQLALLPTLLGDVGLSGAFRAYYPNNASAKLQKQITRFQLRFIFETPLGHGFWLAYHLRPMYFVQSQKTFVNESSNIKLNEHYRFEHLLEAIKTVSSRWGFSQSVGFEERNFYSSTENNLSKNKDQFFSLSTSFLLSLNGVFLKGGIDYETKLNQRESNQPIYNAKDSKYFLMTFVQI